MEQLAQAAAAIAGVFAFALLIAFVIERLVEKFVKPVLDRAGWDVPDYISLALGLVFSWSLGIDLITPLATAVGLDPLVPWIGYLLTGLAVGGGGHLLHDWWPAGALRIVPEIFVSEVSEGPAASLPPEQAAE